MGARVATVLRLVRADISRGRNIDIYALTFLSAALSALSFYNKPQVGIAFAVGALLCSEVLRARHGAENLESKVDELSDRVLALLERLSDPRLDQEIGKLKGSSAPLRRLPDQTRRPL